MPVQGAETLRAAGTDEERGWMERVCEDAEEGQSLIEFALCLPVLLLIVTGILTFGLTFTQYIQLNEAVSTGSRQFAISRGSQGDPCAAGVASIEAAAPSLRSANMKFSFQVYSSATASASYTTSCNGVTLYQGEPVVVTGTYPCNLSWYGVSGYLPSGASSCVLQSRTTEIIQ